MADVNALKTASDNYFAQVKQKLDAMDSDLAQLESNVSAGQALFSNANNEAGNYIGRLLVSQDIAIVRGSEELSRQQTLTQSVNPNSIYDIQSGIFYRWTGSNWTVQSDWTVEGQFETGRIYSNNYIGRLFYYSDALGLYEMNVGKSAPEVLNGTFDIMAASPSARAQHAMAVVGDELFVHGGFMPVSGGAYLPEFLKYDFLNDTWTALTDTSFSVRGHSIDAAGNILYMFGGDTPTGVVNTLRFCSVSGDSWFSINPGTHRPAARERHASCMVGEKLYIYGGRDDNGDPFDDLWVYDVQSNDWTQLASAGFAGFDGAMVHYEGYLYELGSRETASTTTAYIRRYDIAANSWESLGQANSIGSPQAAVIGGKMYVYPGEQTSQVYYVNLENYSGTAGTSIGAPPYTLLLHRMVIWRNRLYTYAGIDNSNGIYRNQLVRVS